MEQFDFGMATPAPLAELLRPKTLDEVVGQDGLLGPDGRLRLMLTQGNLGSVILWGPPDTGKTTIARLLAGAAEMVIEPVSAVFDGVAELRKVFTRAEERRQAGQCTLLFVDEVHRFNKAQQDGLLPRIEDGTVTLVGATTENPSFALNGALLSRAQVLVLERLNKAALEVILARVEAHIGHPLPLDMAARADLCSMADGDGQYLLNMAALLIDRPETPILDTTKIGQIVTARAPVFDKAGDQRYNLTSALHKTLRASDIDAGLYWLNRMLEGGEDPHSPLHILNGSTKMMKDMGYGANYVYDHDDPEGFSGQNCFPDGMEPARYYIPFERWYEREIAKRLAYWDKLRASKKSDDQTS